MKKLCVTCGYIIDQISIEECPNCGSYDLKIIKEDSGDKFKRFKRW